jgi:hypothetical protein
MILDYSVGLVSWSEKAMIIVISYQNASLAIWEPRRHWQIFSKIVFRAFVVEFNRAVVLLLVLFRVHRTDDINLTGLESLIYIIAKSSNNYCGDISWACITVIKAWV